MNSFEIGEALIHPCVLSQLDTVISSFDQYTLTCEHLVSYIFDMLNFSTNSSMERLSLVTVIFLPLTFMAGYYGTFLIPVLLNAAGH